MNSPSDTYSQETDDAAEMVRTETIGYSLPTIAMDELIFVTPTPASFEGAPQFHEDEWRQIEFFPAARLEELQGLLKQYKAFERGHRNANGWTEIYARQLPPVPVMPGRDALNRLAEMFRAGLGNAPILLTTSQALGQVADGFSLRPSSDVTLFGLADEHGIHVLSAIIDGDDRQLVQAFITLHAAAHLLLVDWRGQMILHAVAEDGKLAVWRP
ncbi:hypothetical protein [Dyella silvatica]|uniref:hypothetical protein n=1 Tax=Dyella silvatica TaxID=2992128 RepID=UPI002251662D|nr:hypothetical protein [Dyella silvatica]